jgi:hypothetical protein
MRALLQTAAAEDNAGGDGSGAGLEKITACGHDNFLPWLLFAGVVCHHHARLKGSVRPPSADGKTAFAQHCA